MELVFEAVRRVREIRNRNGLSPKLELTASLSARDSAIADLLKAGDEIIRTQGNLETLEIGVGLAKPPFSGTVASPEFTLHVPLEGKIDRKAEATRTRKEIEKTSKQIQQMERQLANTEFCKRKPEMANELRGKLEGIRGKFTELEEHLKDVERDS